MKKGTLIALIIAAALAAVIAVAWLARGDRDQAGPREVAGAGPGQAEPRELAVPKARPLVGETEKLGDPPANPPRRVITWKITLTKNGGTIGIEYDKVAVHQLTVPQTIDDYLKLLAANNPPADLNWHDPDIRPRPTHQSRETPLSIEHNDYSYIVYWLEDANWYFTPEHEPFEILKGKKHLYLDPKCAWLVGSVATTGRLPPYDAQCRVASFVANSAAEPRDDRGEFVTPFNFYITIRSTKGGRIRYLPIVVDPDVGYPGGNAP
jgi:hypothetical protein